MSEQDNQQQQSLIAARQAVLRGLSQLSDDERASVLRWAGDLRAIQQGNSSTFAKMKAAIRATAQNKAVWPLSKRLWEELKRIAWTERSFPARMAWGNPGHPSSGSASC
jgi:hypothetical protein